MSFHSRRKRVILLHSKRPKKNIIYCAGKLRIRTPFASYALQWPSGVLCTHMYRYIHISIYIYQYMSNISHKIEYIYIQYIYIRIFAFLLLQPKNLCTFGVLAIPKKYNTLDEWPSLEVGKSSQFSCLWNSPWHPWRSHISPKVAEALGSPWRNSWRGRVHAIYTLNLLKCS